jgi:hypothetical protein
MIKHIFNRIHGKQTPFWGWALTVSGFAFLGIAVALTRQSMVHVLTAGFILIIIAKHIGLAALLLGPIRLLWSKLTGNHKKSTEVMQDSVLGNDLTDRDPADGIRVMGYRLRNEFRKRMDARGSFHPDKDTNVATIATSGEEIPDMKLIDAVAEQLRIWQAAGRADVPNARGAAGLLVSAAYGVAAMEFLSRTRIMDGAIDGLTSTIWTGLEPSSRN